MLQPQRGGRGAIRECCCGRFCYTRDERASQYARVHNTWICSESVMKGRLLRSAAAHRVDASTLHELQPWLQAQCLSSPATCQPQQHDEG